MNLTVCDYTKHSDFVDRKFSCSDLIRRGVDRKFDCLLIYGAVSGAWHLRVLPFEYPIEEGPNSSDILRVLSYLMTLSFFDNVWVFGSHGE